MDIKAKTCIGDKVKVGLMSKYLRCEARGMQGLQISVVTPILSP